MTDIFAALGERFERADRQLFLVGGSVRDMVLGREPKDLDFTTDALPDEIEGILKDWADAIWDVGREFGTIAARKDDQDIEITTFRFDGPGRKPQVTFTDDLIEDLKRRDFTINAMAMPVSHLGLHNHASDIVDPFGGLAHINTRTIDTPGTPEVTFHEDPLRMLRAARFASQLSFNVAPRVVEAMGFKRLMIQDISAERIAAELDKLLLGDDPERGLAMLRRTGLLELILPEVDTLPWTLLGDDVETRWADLLSAVDIADVAQRMRALKFSLDRQRDVTALVRLRNEFDGIVWFDAEVRKVLAASGPQFLRLVKLLRASDTLLPLAIKLLAKEGFPVPVLNGKDVINLLGIKPGPKVGEALDFLWNLRLETGPMTVNEAQLALMNWDKVTA